MYFIDYAVSCDESDLYEDYNNEYKPVELKMENDDLIYILGRKTIDYIKKELPAILKEGKSIFINTHVDHDDYFIIETLKSEDWNDGETYCEVRVLLYADGGAYWIYTAWFDLTNDKEIQEFIDDILKEV